MSDVRTAVALRLLFASLKHAGYEWEPQTPDRLLAFRKDPAPFRPLVRLFGLGLAVSRAELLHDGLGEGTLAALTAPALEEPILFDASHLQDSAEMPPVFKSSMAVSGTGDLLIVHDHWPPKPPRDEPRGYVHFAAESAWLARVLSRDLEGFVNKRVLDLGCSSGALAFEGCVVADRVLGLDVSERAIEWARLSAAAHGFRNARFEVAAVGGTRAEELASAEGPWDVVVMNPPMVVPSKDAAYSHRDGGNLGIELPLEFLAFAHRHLRVGGEVQTLITNPIVQGRSAFFDQLPQGHWLYDKKQCLHSKFNQAVARKEGYSERGIERIELWFLHLTKA